ncbi:MAG: DUF2959 domain-containing protein [Opitutales bacterium]|jgi:hypothetical protein|nr:DUF2959 domain-containing protein [Opitutales bacterium]MDP4645426.1 DUF2959 domain-containing protein [Opitutales bacterium]MDP4776412.1 DUF2959 domain-containing protein [Opitutales bacterium]MDP4879624.1 DUF2959 domain-containing protein [Opitutales bacterium]MDP4883643.1 DUF2959 domain-containing protein [Opitutales bacterium]
MKLAITLPILCVALFLSGCQSVYYASMEKLGIEKREILSDRVEAARDEQQEAKETFADALEAFTAVTEYQGGELESIYDKLNAAYKDSLAAAERVTDRIDNVQSVGDALFEEWTRELDAYSSESLRRSSEASLRETKAEYGVMLRKMRAAEKSMSPVLELFEDQVLYLKHNLNARAIAALDAEVAKIEDRVKSLVKEMEVSIAEADSFIRTL